MLVVDMYLYVDYCLGGCVLVMMVNVFYVLYVSVMESVMFLFCVLYDGEWLEVGNVVVDVLYILGYILESVCLLVIDWW